MNRYIIQIFLYLIVIQSGCSNATEFYPYEPTIVELKGVLEQEQKFGPPNFGESPETDEHIAIYVLRLNSPINVGTENTLSDVNDSKVLGISKIQVIFLGSTDKLASKLTGKPVTLHGSLSKQISSHDYYAIVLRVPSTN